MLDGILSNLNSIAEQGLESGSLDKPTLSRLLLTYLDHCGDLSYTNPDTIRYAQRVLGRLIIFYAYLNSPVYKDKINPEHLKTLDCLDKTVNAFFMEKSDLMDKPSWFVEDTNLTGFNNKTSGTTGTPFEYKIWNEAYPKIERNRHYKMILGEYQISSPRTLYVESRLAVPYREIKSGTAVIKLAEKKDFQNPFASLVCSHGDESGEYWHIAFGHDAYLNVNDYFRFLIDFIHKNKINVLLGSGGFIELLTTYLISDDSAAFPKLVQLVSNTGDRVNPETLNFLKETGVTESWCDHMRCWDGGASFFTCEKGTYHLQDELSYVYSTDEGRLVSIDFFSYPSPFINYLNGDYCTVGEDFKLCACGRWHREFKFNSRRNRQFTTTNGGFYDAEEVVKNLLKKFSLGFVSVQDGSVSIEDSNLDDETKEAIVLEMSKLYIMVHFFTNPQLTKLSGQFYGPGCAYCKSYGWGCDTDGYCLPF